MNEWPATKIEMRPIDSLIPYARNSRKHSESQINRVAASIREFGWTIPILIAEDNTIIAGHCRVLSAKKLGITEVPTMMAKGWSEAQRRAYVISDNQLTLLGEWDNEMLKVELMDLKLHDFDLDLIGFDSTEIDSFLKSDESNEVSGDTEAEVDQAEALRSKYGVETGQCWSLGQHRLLCGDSTKSEDVAKVMQGKLADLCFTSPPYGQQRDYRDGATEKVSDWDTLMQGVFLNLPMSESGQVLVNLGLIHRDNEWQPYWENWIQWMRQQGWRRFGWYVWDQGAGMMGDWAGRFAPSFEFVFHFNKKSVKPNKWIDKQEESIKVNTGGGMRNKTGVVGGRSNPEASLQPTKIPDSVIRVNRVAGSDIDHPAMFPVNLSEYAIRSWPGLIYEPFSGSGTTIIAAENLHRVCRAIEISPAYCAVAIERFCKHTNQEPKLL